MPFDDSSAAFADAADPAARSPASFASAVAFSSTGVSAWIFAA